MPLIAKAPESFIKPAPEGNYVAICVDVVDLGMVQSQWGTKHRCRVVWELDEIDPENGGGPFLAKADYTVSLADSANLYKMLIAWRGRAFTPEELRGFDIETIIGKCCMLQIVHNIGTKGGVFANVNNVSGLPKKTAPIEASGHYTRHAKQEHVEDDGTPF